ncbi:MAG: GNAT family N-acetyltransferase [Gemmatimonadetes bacterium]|nr:GNAT family N-acetyltransferase [Gemmatimonadota bacterium]
MTVAARRPGGMSAEPMRPEPRIALREELPAVRDAFRAVVDPLEVYCADARRREMERYDLPYLEELNRADPRNVIVIADGGDVQAFALTRDDDGPLWLCWYGVVPEARGRGLWRPLLGMVLELARARGYGKVWCDARSENTHSIVRLEQMGFRVVCELRRHWHGEDYVLLERWLEE